MAADAASFSVHRVLEPLRVPESPAYPQNMDYRAHLVSAMAAKGNERKRITIRDLANATGYSYEHIRKVYVGEPVGSRDLNRLICGVLGLDEEQMWLLAARQKMERRFRDQALNLAPPEDELVRSAWQHLSPKNKGELRKIVEGMVLSNQVLARRPRRKA